MKSLLLTCLVSLVLSGGSYAQQPDTSPSSSPAATVVTAPTPSPTFTPLATLPPNAVLTPSPTAADDSDSDIERAIKKKLNRHFHTKSSKNHDEDSDLHLDLNPETTKDLAIVPVMIVGIVFAALFGAPVLIVAVIMLVNYFKARSLHRTVRMMVERGQEVPAALFAAPAVQKARSDMRRGIILVMIGVGLIVFLGAVNNWSDGTWSIGMIPALMGAGYLLVWKLERPTDKIPPVV